MQEEEITYFFLRRGIFAPAFLAWLNAIATAWRCDLPARISFLIFDEIPLRVFAFFPFNRGILTSDEKSNNTDDDQVDRDNIIEDRRENQDQNPCQQSEDWVK